MRRIGFIGFALFLLFSELGCGDQYRPVANPIVGQGGQPQNAHYAFVVNYNPVGNSTTFRVDVTGDTNIETQFVGVGAVAESFQGTSTGAVFVANKLSDSVSEFPTSTTNSPLLTINVPPGSRPVALATAQVTAVYVLNSSPNLNCPTTGSISVLNTASLAVTSTTCVGVNPSAIAQEPNGGKVYALNGDNTISAYDPNLGVVVDTITAGEGLGLNPVSIAISQDSAWLYVVDKGDGTTPGRVDLFTTYDDIFRGSVPLGVSPTFSYIDPRLNRLYVTNTGSNSVTVFDISNPNAQNTPIIPTLATVMVGSGPVGVTALADSTKFYTVNLASNNVTVVSASGFNVLSTIPVGTGPTFIASEPGSSKIYTANSGSGNISIIQTSNDTVVSTMNAPQQDPACTTSCALQQPITIMTY